MTVLLFEEGRSPIGDGVEWQGPLRIVGAGGHGPFPRPPAPANFDVHTIGGIEVSRAEDETQLIPTRSRDHLSRSSSYPLSASLLSEGLRDVPQFARLSCDFYSHPQESPLDPGYIVFGGVGSRSSDEWRVWVSAVPSELSAAAREFAVNHAFPFLRAWLSRPREDTWFMHYHWCAIAIDPITNEGILAELEEQRVVQKLPPVHLAPRGSAPGR